ncbi:MAG: ATP-dependent helicase HrpB [Xanthomonadales bacterium]|nr:ATP-dependent helicase HrpB [Xanthomonadales bacterium]
MTPDSALPIHAALPALRAALAARARVVLEAPPGAGKTTAVPLALLDEPWLAGQKILMLEPRRIAARSAATFMARQLGEQPGGRIGYRIRFEARPGSRIEVLTEGILSRLIQDDPALAGVGCLIFDEFHERHLASDLGLALALDAQAGLREDLRILVMSATLDGARLAQWLDAERVESAGRAHPVAIEHLPARREERTALHLARGVEQALAHGEGDVLAFLPGRREIDEAQRALAARVAAHIDLVPLHGELAIEAQAAAMTPAAPGRRRVVLATNVAESSLTLPGVRAVVDSGLAREPRFDPNVGFTRLETVPISLASATQRAGRAGRLGPGYALRLWSPDKRLDAERRAEIVDADLAPLALELAAWGGDQLRFLDPPPAGHLAQARELLVALDALDEAGRITAHGRELLRIGTHPRLANLVVHGRRDPAAGWIPELLALLEARDPLVGEDRFSEDWRARFKALLALRGKHPPGAASPGALRAIDHAAREWRRRLRLPEASATASAHALGDLLIHAFPDRIARLDKGERYQLSGGRGAALRPGSPLTGEPWLAVSDLMGSGADARIARAAPFDADLLQQHYATHFATVKEFGFDAERQAAQQVVEKRFGAIVLERRVEPARDPQAVRSALIAGIRQLGAGALNFSEHQQRLRARVQCLREWLPEAGLPDWSDAALLASLEHWLAPALTGITRLANLGPDRLGAALLDSLDYAQRQLLEREAPDALTVPSGMTRRLEYTPGGPPVLAVKLQELFGLADTPRIARGRVPVTLHLLSPGGRPIQVTQDLKGFWDRTYAEVRKELKGRYPKHPWPDDPWSARATHRAKPRGT